MFYTQSDRMFTENADDNHRTRVPLHNVDNGGEQPHEPGEANSASEASEEDGMWGERDVGGPVNFRLAMQDFGEMQKELTSLSKTRTNKTNKSGKSGRSVKKHPSTNLQNSQGPDVEAIGNEKPEADDEEEGEEEKAEEEFELDGFLKDGHFEKRDEGGSAKKVGVIYKNLTVKGVGATSTFVRTFPDVVLGTFGPDLYKVLSRMIPLPQFGSRGAMRDLIHDFTGAVRDGEMLLVLGRPGSGCSTFLKAISNKREGFAGVEGEVHYGGISAEEQKKSYRGEVNYNEEDDQHLPTLTVEQALKFSLLNKTKKHHKGDIPVIVSALLKMFGISHTRHTLVGDAFVRGISGGERKRVSIAETLATKSTVVAWDNSTRGLDASTALDYANSLRVLTDISNRTTIVTLYQAGEQIYELMDKVLVIDEGRMVYSGPANDAKKYFQRLGYFCPDRQTTADFLTACTDPVERRFRDDFEGPIPKGPIELEKAFRESEDYKHLLQDVEAYEKRLDETNHADARQFKQSVQEAKSKTVSKRSSYTVSFFRQVLACTRREFWLLLGDKPTLYTKFSIILSISLIVGSLFYGQSLDTGGAFSRGGTLFLSIVFLGWLQLSEMLKAVSGRPVIARHKDYAFYRPSAVVIARVLLDFPLLLLQTTLFAIITYFLAGLDVDVSKFFIFFLFTYVTTICLTALYRMFAALSSTLDDALRFSVTALNVLIVFTGYFIPKPQLLHDYIWFGWLYYINPLSYAFEAVLSNEFSNRSLPCAEQNIIPSGATYTDPAYRGCSFTGASLGSLRVSGSAYLEKSYEYSRSNLWRNFGVVIAFTVLYILITMVATEIFSFANSGGGALEFKKSRKSKQQVQHAAAPNDEEKVKDSTSSSSPSSSNLNGTGEGEALPEISGSGSVFTWENVEYTVPYLRGERKLLNKIDGYAKPGVMVALMGASGAGKTTLLNTLSQRQKTGVVGGDMLVDGRPLGTEFQRGTGFCEQMDVHDGTATIREALEFSALLRQDRNVPRAEKIEYVDKIVDLLELSSMQDTLIRSLGVEQRKRVTIGVELAAKPNLLLFLDEPTSGLDSQSAYSIVRFLKKLAQSGQAIVCTIHQPSSVLIQEFDMILALNPGGNTFYFGPVGDNGSAVVKYFADRGVQCPPEKNIAEFILETAAKGGKRKNGKKLNWNDEWRNSEEASQVKEEIQRIKAERSKVEPQAHTQHEFASPVWLQTTELTKRMFVQNWRDSSYLYGKLFASVIIGIMNGFTFWKLGYSVTYLQDRLFTVYLILVFPPVIVNGVVPKFYQNRAIWEARELPSRLYGWFAFCTAQIVSEIPSAIIGATVYWALWYWPTGLPTDSSTSGYVFLMSVLMFLFQASWGQWICAFAPSFTVISNVLPFFFVMFFLFNGVVRPYAMIPVFWRYWMYYLNPSTYWVAGVLAATLPNIPVQCTADEAAYFSSPPGKDCATYLTDYLSTHGVTGYLSSEANGVCGFCEYSNGTDYLTTLNIKPSDKWPYFGIFLAFCISNWFLVYFLIYTVRIKGWTFGFGPLFDFLRALTSRVKGLFGGKEQEAHTGEE